MSERIEIFASTYIGNTNWKKIKTFCTNINTHVNLIFVLEKCGSHIVCSSCFDDVYIEYVNPPDIAIL